MYYLYNGVKLPDISEIAGTGYPYWLVFQNTSTGEYFGLGCIDVANPAQGFVKYSEGNLVSVSGVGIYGTQHVFSDGAWAYVDTPIAKTISLDGIRLIWTNTDIPDESGGIYFAATEPVPVLIVCSIQCPDSVTKGLFIFLWCSDQEGNSIDFSCTLSGHTSSMTKLLQAGERTLRLYCGSDETAGSLSIQVASAEDPSATASKTIAVLAADGGGGDSGGPSDPGPTDPSTTSKVTGIDMYVYPDRVAPGGLATIEVFVSGEGDYSDAFRASILGQLSNSTQFSASGNTCNLLVGTDETAQSILVTAVSVQNPDVMKSVLVTIDYGGETTDETTEEEQIRQMFWNGFAAAKARFRQLDFTEAETISFTKDGEPATMDGKLKRSFWRGFVAGSVLGAVLPPMEPVAYLYNGVRLPELPEWDKTAYPYAAVMGYSDEWAEAKGNTTTTRYLLVSRSPFTIKYSPPTGYLGGVYYLQDLTNSPSWTVPYGGSEWEKNGEVYGYATRIIIGTNDEAMDNQLLWSNHNIMYGSSIYLAESDPVQVKE